MMIEYGIRPNCSEWDEEMQADDYDDYPKLPIARRKDIEEKVKELDWDADRNGSTE